MKYLRWLLFPFSLLYGLAVTLRNWCYDAGIYRSNAYNMPIICIGNLEVGGAGKSPMTEYLIALLKNNFRLATLSRGYGRNTKGFVLATNNTSATEVGDEPAQFKHKFPAVTVAVCEKRTDGIEKLMQEHELIILDDAYQHRAVAAGFSILLFDYTHLLQPQLLLPAGNLREPFSGRTRANILVVSKCPNTLTTAGQQACIKKLKPASYQQVFFTAISYKPLQLLNGGSSANLITGNTVVFLLTGIANTIPLVQHIAQYTMQIVHHKYADHHQYSLKNIAKLADEFNRCTASDKIIITTEKDAQRLRKPELQPYLHKLPVYVLPIGITFLNEGAPSFDQLIYNYVKQYTEHSSIH